MEQCANLSTSYDPRIADLQRQIDALLAGKGDTQRQIDASNTASPHGKADPHQSDCFWFQKIEITERELQKVLKEVACSKLGVF